MLLNTKWILYVAIALALLSFYGLARARKDIESRRVLYMGTLHQPILFTIAFAGIFLALAIVPRGSPQHSANYMSVPPTLVR